MLMNLNIYQYGLVSSLAAQQELIERLLLEKHNEKHLKEKSWKVIEKLEILFEKELTEEKIKLLNKGRKLRNALFHCDFKNVLEILEIKQSKDCNQIDLKSSTIVDTSLIFGFLFDFSMLRDEHNNVWSILMNEYISILQILDNLRNISKE